MEFTFFDRLSIWIRNKQHIENINQKQWDSLQKDIIANVFDGFDSLMHCLLKNKNTLNISQHNKLYQTLDSYCNTNVCDNMSNSSSLTSINDNCILHIASFLNSNDKYNMKQCCRILTLTIQQNTFMKTLPYIDVIIKGIESNDNKQQLKSLQLYHKYMKYDYNDIYYQHIRKYNPKTFEKFTKIILDNRKNKMCQDIGLHLLKYQFQTTMIPLAIDTLNTQNSETNNHNNIQVVFNSISCINESNIRKYIEYARESIPKYYINKMVQMYSLKNIHLSFEFLRHLTNKSMTVNNVLNSTDNMSIDIFKQVVIHNMKRIKNFRDNTEQNSEAKEDIDNNIKIPPFLMTDFIDMMIEMIKDNTVANHWRSMDHFFQILYEYTLLGHNERNYLIDKQVINILGDFVLGRNLSPYANDEKEYVVMGSRMEIPPFDAAIQIICTLLCACHTTQTKEQTFLQLLPTSLSFKDAQNNVCLHSLSEKDQQLVDHCGFYQTLVNKAHNSKSVLQSLEELIVHWSYENQIYSDQIINIIDEGIDKSGADIVETYLTIMRRFIMIEDSQQMYRIEQLHAPIQPNKRKGVLHYIKCYRLQHAPFSYECIKAIIFLMIEYEKYENYIINKREEWVFWDTWLDRYCHRPSYIHNQDNERLLQLKIAFFVDTYIPLLRKHGINCHRLQQKF